MANGRNYNFWLAIIVAILVLVLIVVIVVWIFGSEDNTLMEPDEEPGGDDGAATPGETIFEQDGQDATVTTG